MNIRSFYRRLLSISTFLPENVRVVITIIVLSLAAALSAVAFMTAINLTFRLFYLTLHLSKLAFAGVSFCVIIGTSLAAALLLRTSPDAAGSGIPQAKAAYWKELGYIPMRSVLVKCFAGILNIGGGASLGREGPTVYLGAGVASFLSGFMGSAKRQRRLAVAIGSAAGLAAAFNTPMAAITFFIEEVVGDLNSRYLGPVVIASIVGAITVHALLGNQPAFPLPLVQQVSWYQFILVPIVAVLATLAAILFQNWTLLIRGRLKTQRRLPKWLMPCIGGFITWIIAISVFSGTGRIGVFGLGYLDLSDALHHNVVWWVAGILVVAKLLATTASYGFGGCGGIFSPTLFIGGMIGTFVSGLAGLWLPLTPSDHIILAAAGMSACMGGLLRAPLTSTLIVFEMTHQFEIVPGLMLGMVISQFLVRLMGGKHNFYDALLLQDGHELIRIKPPRDLQSWQNLSIASIMKGNPAIIMDVETEPLKALLSSTPYQRYPLVKNDSIEGIVSREAILSHANEGRALKIDKAPVCRSNESIRIAGDRFMESPAGMVVVVDEISGKVVGIVTLHDLLRAQAAVIE